MSTSTPNGHHQPMVTNVLLWANGLLLCGVLWFIKDSYQGIRFELHQLRKEIGKVQVETSHMQAQVEMLKQFNIQPKK